MSAFEGSAGLTNRVTPCFVGPVGIDWQSASRGRGETGSPFRGKPGPAVTVKAYLRIVQEFAKHVHQPPDKLGPEHLRQYQAHLFQQRKLDAGTVQQYVAALRFFFVKTLKRRDLQEEIPMPRPSRKLPEILSPDEVAALIDSASNLFHRTMLMTFYSTGTLRSLPAPTSGELKFLRGNADKLFRKVLCLTCALLARGHGILEEVIAANCWPADACLEMQWRRVFLVSAARITGTDAKARVNFAMARQKQFILREERNFIEVVEGTFELPANEAGSPQRHCASRSKTGERYGVEERSRAARTVGSRAGNACLPGYQLRVLLVPHDKRFISWSRGKAIAVAGHRGVVKAREARLNGVGVRSGRFGIPSSEDDGARVEPAGAAGVRGSFPCDLRRAVPLEATGGKVCLPLCRGQS